jgi:hypothetical protein
VDGYLSVNFDGGKPQNDGNSFRAFDRNNGFSLSWAALDIGYSAEQVGATINLRFGPSASVLAGRPSDPALAATSDTDNGLQFVKQAFATWRPGGGHFTLDFGKFDTIYGTEVADSQKNLNYTRGLLYTLAQPHHHTGLRAGFSMDGFTATVMIVNGWNEAIDKNLGKGLGLGVGYSLKRADGSGNLFTAKLGYLLSPESLDYATRACAPGEMWVPTEATCRPAQSFPQGSPNFIEDRGGTNGSSLRHFLDLALLFEPIDSVLVTLNGDYGHDVHTDQLDPGPNDAGLIDNTTTADWFGVSLAGRYRFLDMWGVAVRGEYLSDPEHFLCNAQRARFGTAGLCRAAGIVPISEAEQLGQNLTAIGQGFAISSFTLTLEALPVDHLVIRLDGRYDTANADVFVGTNEQRADQITTTLGVVATTD